MWWSHNTRAQSEASHCLLTSLTGDWMFTDAQEGLFWLVAKLLQGHAISSLDIQNGTILSRQPLYILLFNFYLANCSNNFIPTYFKSLASVNVFFTDCIFQNSVFFYSKIWSALWIVMTKHTLAHMYFSVFLVGESFDSVKQVFCQI